MSDDEDYEFVYHTGRPPYLPTDWHVLSDGSKHNLSDCAMDWCGRNPVEADRGE